MSATDEVDGVTLGEVVRLLRALTEQVGTLSRDITHRFDDIGRLYVRRDMYDQRMTALNDRLTLWEQQKDVLLVAVQTEMQKVHRDIADVEERALKEIEAVEDRRVAALEKVAAQRHSDRVTYVGWLLTAVLFPLIAGVLIALATGTWQP